MLSEGALPSLIEALRRLGVPKAAAIHFPKFRKQLAAKREAKTKEQEREGTSKTKGRISEGSAKPLQAEIRLRR